MHHNRAQRALRCRELSKAVQTELANANSVAEEALSSMATVKAHAAETSTRHAYQQRLRAFGVLQACTAPHELDSSTHNRTWQHVLNARCCKSLIPQRASS